MCATPATKGGKGGGKGEGEQQTHTKRDEIDLFKEMQRTSKSILKLKCFHFNLNSFMQNSVKIISFHSSSFLEPSPCPRPSLSFPWLFRPPSWPLLLCGEEAGKEGTPGGGERAERET